MLTPAISDGFVAGVAAVREVPGVQVVAGGGDGPAVFRVDAETFLRTPTLRDEVFGPTTLMVEYDDEARLHAALDVLEGSLTGTIHAQPGEEIGPLVDLLASRVGRLLFAGWPTGVAVTWAQHHGGPWPATTTQHTSVGATAVRRFQRPIAYQDAPAAILPPALHDDNPLRIPRRIDGVLTLP